MRSSRTPLDPQATADLETPSVFSAPASTVSRSLDVFGPVALTSAAIAIVTRYESALGPVIPDPQFRYVERGAPASERSLMNRPLIR